jgi:hemerythrin-like metal-binding protein
MALITWNDNLSVGVHSVDEQHKGLVNTLNELHAAMLGGKQSPVTGPLLKSLIQYTHTHFNFEESLMRRTVYPRIDDHCAKHKDLTRQVGDFAARYDRGEIGVNVELLMFLRNWLVNHIKKEDRDYGPWLNQHGIK